MDAMRKPRLRKNRTGQRRLEKADLFLIIALIGAGAALFYVLNRPSVAFKPSDNVITREITESISIDTRATLRLINKTRKASGVPPLKEDPELNKAAMEVLKFGAKRVGKVYFSENANTLKSAQYTKPYHPLYKTKYLWASDIRFMGYDTSQQIADVSMICKDCKRLVLDKRADSFGMAASWEQVEGTYAWLVVTSYADSKSSY